jgi:octaprenyl-diphosphate synthase
MATKTTETLLDEGLSSVEAYLASLVTSDVQTLYDASQHILTSGGKRVRPQVLLLAYLAAGGQDIEEAIPLATAVETLHTATLVHDDINDHSRHAPGQSDGPRRWGRTFALLTGDYLFTKVYELMAPYGTPYNEIMSSASVRLVEGETLQAIAAKAGEMDRETYKKSSAARRPACLKRLPTWARISAAPTKQLIEALAIMPTTWASPSRLWMIFWTSWATRKRWASRSGIDMAQNRGVMMVQNGGTAVLKQNRPMIEDDPLPGCWHDLRESGAVEIARMQANEVANRARAALHLQPALYGQNHDAANGRFPRQRW